MADDTDKQIEQVGRLSVQKQRDAYFFGGAITFGAGYEAFGNSLPSIYDARRQWMLNRIDAYPQNNLWQGAVAKIAHKVSGTSAEITGKRRVKYYQDVIMFQSDKGGGIQRFVEKIIHDFLVYDDGAVVEIIGRGEPDSELAKEAIVGIAVLDPLRCFFTMNDEFPVWYQDSVSGKLHKLHRSRVHRFVDQPLTDPELRGRGLSALSRAIGFVQQAIVNQTYIGEMLSNEPAPGIMMLYGITEKSWSDAWAHYNLQRQQKGLIGYKPYLEYFVPRQAALNEETQSALSFTPFSSAPQNYDPITLTELEAKGIALALDIDPNDVLPLQGGNFGNGQQAKVLDQKNRDGGFTHLLKMLERFFNSRILPDPLRFEWRYRDSEQSLQSAEIASKHMTFAKEFVTTFGNSKKAQEVMTQYLADAVDGLGDILRDPDGEMVTLFDDDPGEDIPDAQQVATDIDAEDAPTGDGTQTAQDDVTVPAATKEYSETQFGFERDFAAIVIDANNGDIASRRRAGTLLRATLTKYGRRAVFDGLEAGGVIVDNLEGDDLDEFLSWNAEQSGYVSGFTQRIWDQGLSEPQIYASVSAWTNKSLQGAYMIGLQSADANGMYEFTGDDGEESCPDCKRMKGQVHRLKDYRKRKLRPGVDTDNFECGGFQCEHRLVRVNRTREKGRW